MALFLEVHELHGESAQAFAGARSRVRDDIRCLKHWLSEDGRSLALLVEAPSEDVLRASQDRATETTELFAPAERWMSYDSIEVAR